MNNTQDDIYKTSDDLTEHLEILDRWGDKTGKTKHRKQILLDAEWHASSHIYIVNNKNQVLLQRRSLKKLILPGLLACPVGGHIKYLTSPVTTAVQEAKEELGLTIKANDLNYLGIGRGTFDTNPQLALHEREFIYVFIFDSEIEFDLNIKNDEVEGLFWFEFEDFKSMVNNKSDELIPTWICYEMVLDYIENLRGKL
jgi:isopentenyldiphosphate isomerase